MKRALLPLVAALLALLAPVCGAQMTQEALHAIILEAAPDARGQGNVMVFSAGGAGLLCISDPLADRMRIITPIKRLEDASAEELLAALHANFHTVLDVRYAASGGTIFAAFLHPLSSVTREQVLSAISQLAHARASFGAGFSGGGPAFGGR